MSTANENICRFCLRTVHDVFQIDKMTMEILDLLLLKFDLNNTRSPVMCYECATMLQKAFKFKSACIYTEDCIFPFTNSKRNPKVGLQEVYLKINETESIENVKRQKICRFCMKLNRIEHCTSVSEIVQITLINKLLEEHFPETVLNSIEDSVICEDCFNFLHLFLIFVITLSDVETKIKLYVGSIGKVSGRQVNLSNVQQFLLQPAIKDTVTCAESSGHQSEHVNCKTLEDNELGKMNDGRLTEMQNLQLDIKIEEIGIKFGQDDSKSIPNESFEGIPGQKDDDKTKSEKAVLKRKRYKCKNCTFKTKRRKLFKEHLLNHKEIWKCHLCNYKAKRERSLKDHMIIHKDPSEVTIFKCDKCEYESRRKKNVNFHMQTHKNSSQVPVYDCPLCTYTTNCRQTMNRHVNSHRNYSGMYECKNCTFVSRSAYNIRKHLLVHGDPIKCELCSFQTKYKKVLTKHALIHHTPSPKLQLYKCSNCAFETYSKGSLTDHRRRQHNPSTTTLRRCDTCGYETRNSGHLMQHMLTHKDASQVTMYKCELCPHETKYKGNFAKHMNRHKHRIKKDILRSEVCAREMECEEDLKNHMFSQKNQLLPELRNEICIRKVECEEDFKNMFNQKNQLLLKEKNVDIV